MKRVASIQLLAVLAGPMAATGILAQSGEFYSHGNPSAHEQLMLEWVNAARANPPAEMKRLGIGLNDGLPAGQISPTPKQPLAFNASIIAAARAHSSWMLATNTFSHNGINGSRAINRMADAGYPFVAPYLWGENVSWRGNTAAIDITETTRMNHDGLMRSPGHRVNLMADRADEAGFGILQGKFVSGGSFNANMVTQNFAQSAGSPRVDAPFVTGVVYLDANKNGAYDVGEGLSGVTITTSAGSHHTVTSISGGYAVPVLGASSATLMVTAQGNGLAATSRPVAWTGTMNVKVDFATQPDMIAIPTPVDSDSDGIADGMDLFNSSAAKTPIHANTRWEWMPPAAIAGANRFEAKGLPSGLKLDPTTGAISGLPNKPGNYTLMVRALHGKTWGEWQSTTLEVRGWPRHATGSFIALVSRDASLNQSLGGLLQASTTSLGQLTGSLRLGGQAFTFRSQLAGDPGETSTAVVSIPRKGLPSLVLNLSWDAVTGFTGSLGNGTSTAVLAGWKKTWDAKTNPAPFALHGQFNAVLPVVSNAADTRPVPQGSGWTTLRVDSAGVATFSGKTADGAPFTSALPLGPDGEIALWTLPGKVPATLMGQAEITGEFLDGSLGWVKLPQAGRSWPLGFGTAAQPVRLSLKGAIYTAPVTGTALDAWGLPAAYPNALASADGATAFTFAINPNGAAAVAKAGTAGNPNGAKVSINPKTGLVTGSWVLTDVDPNNPAKTIRRAVSFESVIVLRDDEASGAFARGFHLVPSLPDAGQNANATMMVSGNACMFPNPL